MQASQCGAQLPTVQYEWRQTAPPLALAAAGGAALPIGVARGAAVASARFEEDAGDIFPAGH